MLVSVGVQSPTEIKASGGWQRCADEDVALMCDAHLAGNNAEALLKDKENGHFTAVMLIKTIEDEERFKKIFDIKTVKIEY